MNPFLWLLFVLAAAVVATLCAALALGIVKMWRELPPRREQASTAPATAAESP